MKKVSNNEVSELDEQLYRTLKYYQIDKNTITGVFLMATGQRERKKLLSYAEFRGNRNNESDLLSYVFFLNQQKVRNIEKLLIEKLKNKFGENFSINNDFNERTHDILNVRIKPYNNMVLLKAISPMIAASTGSACSVSKPSRVLKNIGLSEDIISQSIRLSFSPYMDIKDLDEIDKL